MTSTLTDHTFSPSNSDQRSVAEPAVLDGGLFFQRLPVIEQARRLAADGIDVTVTVPLASLDEAPLTGTSRSLLAVAVECHMREALSAAGYCTITRRHDVTGVLVLDASP